MKCYVPKITFNVTTNHLIFYSDDIYIKVQSKLTYPEIHNKSPVKQRLKILSSEYSHWCPITLVKVTISAGGSISPCKE